MFSVHQVDTLSAESKGLPTKGLPTPTSTVYSLTKELEHSLDLQSATAGSRMVTARQVGRRDVTRSVWLAGGLEEIRFFREERKSLFTHE